MNFLVNEIVEYFYAFLLPFARISAFTLAVPVFSLDAFNLRFRIIFAAILTIFAMDLTNFNAQEIDTISLIWLVITQIFIGLFAGFSLQIVSGAVAVGGQAVSNSMGLSMANMMDPNLGNVPIIAQFLIILSTFIFLAVDGHLIIVQLLIQSFASFPIGQGLDLNSVYEIFSTWTPLLFMGGLVLALPLMISILLVNAGLGMITRAAPSLNIISVGFPAILLAGFFLLMFSMPGVIQRIGKFWESGFELLANIFGIT
jgi:flagellar biosynthetic protein FliR